MTPSEDTLAQLSRLLDGELSMDEATALRARIDAEPELAAAWDALLDLDAELADLVQPAPPEGLDAQVLAGAKDLEIAPAAETPRLDLPTANTPRWAWGLLAAGLLMAATPLLALTDWAQPAPPTLTLASGQQVVDGPALVLLPDGRRLNVEGSVQISVEPPAPLPRVEGQEVEMNPKILLAAAAGAAVTVAVYEGSATLSGPEGDQVLEAGEQTSVGQPVDAPLVSSPAEARVTEREVAPPAGSPESPEAMQEEIQRLTLQNDFLQGQLAALGANPNPWPDELPAAFTPQGFEDAITAKLADYPDIDLLDIDCSEYPCVAILEDRGDDPSREGIEAYRQATTEAMEADGPVNSSAWGAVVEDETGSRYVEVWAVTADEDMDNSNPRLDLRAKDLLQAELGTF